MAISKPHIKRGQVWSCYYDYSIVDWNNITYYEIVGKNGGGFWSLRELFKTNNVKISERLLVVKGKIILDTFTHISNDVNRFKEVYRVLY